MPQPDFTQPTRTEPHEHPRSDQEVFPAAAVKKTLPAEVIARLERLRLKSEANVVVQTPDGIFLSGRAASDLHKLGPEVRRDCQTCYRVSPIRVDLGILLRGYSATGVPEDDKNHKYQPAKNHLHPRDPIFDEVWVAQSPRKNCLCRVRCNGIDLHIHEHAVSRFGARLLQLGERTGTAEPPSSYTSASWNLRTMLRLLSSAEEVKHARRETRHANSRYLASKGWLFVISGGGILKTCFFVGRDSIKVTPIDKSGLTVVDTGVAHPASNGNLPDLRTRPFRRKAAQPPSSAAPPPHGGGTSPTAPVLYREPRREGSIQVRPQAPSTSVSEVISKLQLHPVVARLLCARGHDSESISALLERAASDQPPDPDEPETRKRATPDVLEVDGELISSDIYANLAAAIAELMPFNSRNPSPKFLVKNLEITSIRPAENDATRIIFHPISRREDGFYQKALRSKIGDLAMFPELRIGQIVNIAVHVRPRYTPTNSIHLLKIEILQTPAPPHIGELGGKPEADT